MLERATSITMLLGISMGLAFNVATITLAVMRGHYGDVGMAVALMGLLIFFGWSFIRDLKEMWS